MKKSIVLITQAAAVILVLFFVQACNNCNGVACLTPPSPVYLEIRDQQDRDLLNPQTPGHYDTLKIRQLNTPLVSFVKSEYPYPNADRVKIVLPPGYAGSERYLKLSDTDQDTLFLKQERFTEKCCAGYKLVSFTYNNKPLDLNAYANVFTIKK